MRIKKTSGTAVLKGNVVDNLEDNSTTNAPSQRAVSEAIQKDIICIGLGSDATFSNEEGQASKLDLDGVLYHIGDKLTFSREREVEIIYDVSVVMISAIITVPANFANDYFGIYIYKNGVRLPIVTPLGLKTQSNGISLFLPPIPIEVQPEDTLELYVRSGSANTNVTFLGSAANWFTVEVIE